MIKITPIDEKAEVDGEWSNYRGVDLLIARNNNVNFKRSFRRHSKPYKRQIETNTLDEEASLEILTSSISEAILLNWKNFKINGKDVPYSKENAKSLLANDPDCLDFVQTFSSDLNNYLTADKDEVVGESKTSSGG